MPKQKNRFMDFLAHLWGLDRAPANHVESQQLSPIAKALDVVRAQYAVESIDFIDMELRARLSRLKNDVHKFQTYLVDKPNDAIEKLIASISEHLASVQKNILKMKEIMERFAGDTIAEKKIHAMEDQHASKQLNLLEVTIKRDMRAAICHSQQASHLKRTAHLGEGIKSVRKSPGK